MGNSITKEEVEDGIHFIQINHPIQLVFPGYKEGEKEFLKLKLQTAEILEKIPGLIEKLATPFIGESILEHLISMIPAATKSIEKALLMLQVEQMIAKNIHSLIKAKMESIENQLKLSQVKHEVKRI